MPHRPNLTLCTQKESVSAHLTHRAPNPEAAAPPSPALLPCTACPLVPPRLPSSPLGAPTALTALYAHSTLLATTTLGAAETHEGCVVRKPGYIFVACLHASQYVSRYIAVRISL